MKEVYYTLLMIEDTDKHQGVLWPDQAQATEAIHEFNACMSSYEDALNLLCKLILDQGKVIWVQDDVSAIKAKVKICDALKSIEHEKNGDAHQTIAYPALMGIPLSGAQCIHRINLLKNQLGAMLRAMDKTHVWEVTHKTVRGRKITLSDFAVNQLGFHRFFRRQVRRQIPLIGYHPDWISYGWANKRKIYKTSVAHELKKIEQQSDRELDPARDILEDLDRGAPLAIVRNGNRHPRVNVALRVDHGLIYRDMVRGTLPLFYVQDPHRAAPHCRALPPEDAVPAPRLPRLDKRISDQPLIESLHLHTYVA